MKYILPILLLILSSCSSEIHNNGLPIENSQYTNYGNIYKNTTVIFLGPNISDGAQYLIYISCTDLYPNLEPIRNIPKDKQVRIDLSHDCKNHRIPTIVVDTITTTSLYYVSFISGFSSGLAMGEYRFDNEETIKIGKAKWKIQILNGFNNEQYKIIRNTKNPIREAFEPTGTSQFYTEKEQEECDKYFKEAEGIDDMKLWQISVDKVLKCYHNLPPLP